MKFGSYGDYDDDDDRNGKSEASKRGTFDLTLEMKNGLGGSSKEEKEHQEAQAYVRNYGDVNMPKEGSKAREGRERVEDEAKGLPQIESFDQFKEMADRARSAAQGVRDQEAGQSHSKGFEQGD